MKEFTFNKIVNPQILEEEIRDSSIKVALDTVVAYGNGTVVVYMKADLDVADTTTLTELVNTHIHMETVETPQVVEVLEERGEKTQGCYQSIMWKWDIAECTPGSEVILEAKTFPYPISALSLEWYNTPEVNGDHMALLVAPDTIVGALTQPVTAGSDTVYASETVMVRAFMGYKYELVNGAESFKPGRVINVDKGAGTLQFENVIPTDFPAGSYLRQTVELAPMVYLLDRYIPEIGSNRIGGTYIPTGIPMVVRYTNMNGQAKSLYIMLEYIY